MSQAKANSVAEDITAEAFVRYQKSVASYLRYVEAQENLEALHDLARPLEVLDAAGGNGLNTEFLLRRGHAVTLLDSDPAMLEDARGRLAREGLLENCRLVEGTLETVAERVPRGRFDLILCHHVLEYTDETPAILAGFADVASPRGEVSLITLNPVSEVIRAAIFHHDAALAEAKLTDLSYDAKWFGEASLYPFDQLVQWVEGAGWSVRDFRAIRVLADYIPQNQAELQRDALVHLERCLASLEPYRRFGRYFQFCLTRAGA